MYVFMFFPVLACYASDDWTNRCIMILASITLEIDDVLLRTLVKTWLVVVLLLVVSHLYARANVWRVFQKRKHARALLTSASNSKRLVSMRRRCNRRGVPVMGGLVFHINDIKKCINDQDMSHVTKLSWALSHKTS